MSALEILDCTLRDGGYYTNWDFESDLVKRYIGTLSDLPINYIEIGYRNHPTSSYFGEYYYSPLSTIKKISEMISSEMKIALMLDSKKCDYKQIPLLLKGCHDSVDLIRFTVPPDKLDHGISVAKAAKELGFSVAVNLMYLSKIDDLPTILDNLVGLDQVIDYLYLVDSFGACFPEQIGQSIRLAKDMLPQKIGFHGHDNTSLAFANSLAALKADVDILDSTVLGMGRGAGNLRTEILLAYIAQLNLEDSPEALTDLSTLADLVQVFRKMQDEYRWGSEFPYVVSGFNNLPQKEVMSLISKHRYSTSAIVETLQEKAKFSNHNHHKDVYPNISSMAVGLDLDNMGTSIIVGGGASVAQHVFAIGQVVRAGGHLLIHSTLTNAEYFSSMGVPQILCLPGREVENMKSIPTHQLNNQFAAYVLSSSRLMNGSLPPKIESRLSSVAPIVPESNNSEEDICNQDSPLGIALGSAIAVGTKQIYLVGFDGYSKIDKNNKEISEEMQMTISHFIRTYPDINICSLTPTCYSVPKNSIYALLSQL